MESKWYSKWWSLGGWVCLSLIGCQHYTSVSTNLQLAVLPFLLMWSWAISKAREGTSSQFWRSQSMPPATNPLALLRALCWEQTWVRWPDAEWEGWVGKFAFCNNPFPRELSVGAWHSSLPKLMLRTTLFTLDWAQLLKSPNISQHCHTGDQTPTMWTCRKHSLA